MQLEGERATIYHLGPLGASKIEAAQFRIGSETSEGKRVVQYRAPRARLWKGFQTRALLVVLDGLGHPAHPTMDRNPDGRSETTRFACYAPEWRGDFDRFMAGYLESGAARVLLDARKPAEVKP
jgi:hypothetical protein